MDSKQLSASGKQVYRMMEFDDDEKLIYEIRKHPIGLLFIYVIGTFIIIMMLGVALLGAFMNGDPLGLGSGSSVVQGVLIVVGMLMALLALGAVAIEAYIYQANVILVTSDKLSQLLYRTIFDRKISQLSIGDIQDVTVRQQGILPRLFNYGTLMIETSGEQNNYLFTFAPRPYAAAQAIQNAHESNLKLYGN